MILAHMNVTLFGKRVFADVIWKQGPYRCNQVKVKSYCVLKWELNSITDIFTREIREKFYTKSHRHTEKKAT